MMKHCIKILGALSVLVLGACSQEGASPQAPPPASVLVVKTQAQRVPLYSEFVGQTAGLKDIDIRARIEGFVEGMHFQEGSRIKQGDLLYSLESQSYEEKVAGRLSAVAEAETMLAKARGDLDRIEPLARMNAVSQSDLDSAQASYDAANASLDAAEANLRAAQIELGYTEIRSPIDGIIGRSKAKVGDFVGRDPNPVILNTVSKIDSILVTFFITETQYLEIATFFARMNASEELGKVSNLRLILVDGSVYEHKGKGDFIDREVDSSTGSLLVQASFPNPEGLLRPGQFVKVRAKGRVVEDGILIPQRCVMELQGLYSVYVVDAENRVQTRDVKVGPKIGSDWLISEGLKSGDLVIYEGLQKVRPGAKVKARISVPQIEEKAARDG